MTNDSSVNHVRWLVCGAAAGFTVDLSLFPIDTIKTRLQSEKGFIASGGFKNIYKGVGAVALGAAPGSAVFFLTYKSLKQLPGKESPLIDALSASGAEVAACIVRVPTEHVKQLAQTSRYKEAKGNLSQIVRAEIKLNGVMGLYRGYISTICREIPFSFIQFPLWEGIKRKVAKFNGKDKCNPFEAALCGSVAGSFSAFVTTPLDVAKTRIMLDINNEYKRSIIKVWKKIIQMEGPCQLYAGASVRTAWMAAGGFVYFFGYEFSMKMWGDFVGN
uniref:S-adenosylmethionine mitochondrial carrier protein n=1 Tax=Rhabditophanes sp. KR3021 TaxID=114890 RepID=A0AC35TUV0_9BILA